MARRTQQERRTETRRALLDAAATLFADRGFHAVSLDEIAAAAGYTRGALHYNFAGKPALLLGLLDRGLATRAAALPATAPGTPGLVGALPFDRQASLLFLELALQAARERKLGNALLAHLGQGREDARPAVAATLEQMGLPSSAARELQPIVAAFVNGLGIEALAGADLAVLEERFRRFLELLLAGLRAS